MAKLIQSTKVLTNTVRFCYVNIVEPVTMTEGQTPKYRICVLIPKTDKETLDAILSAIESAKKVGLDKGLGKSLTHSPLRDGDTERPDDENFAGHFFLNAASLNQPPCINENLEPITNLDELYSGCYGKAYLQFYPYSTSGNKGVGVGISALQKTAEGERLSGESMDSILNAFNA